MRAQARGNIKKATGLFDEILRHYPNDTNALYLRAMLEIKKADYDKALAFVQKCRKTHPDHAGFLYLLGYTSFQIGRYFDAIRSLKQAVKLQPDYPMAQLLLANVYRRTGRFELGESVLSNVKIQQTNDSELILTHANILRDFGREEQGMAILKSMLDRNQMVPEVLYEITSFGEEALSDEHLALLHRIADSENLAPKSRCMAQFALGRHYDRTGSYDVAFNFFEEANRLDAIANNLPTPMYDIRGYAHAAEFLIGMFDKAFFEQRTGFGSPDRSPIFVVGLPRSGKTLVEALITQHPDCFGAGELSLHAYLDSDLFLPLNGSLPRNMKEKLLRLNKSTSGDQAKIYIDLVRKYSGSAKYIVNTLPQNLNNLGILRLLFPKCKIIIVDRNPLDTGMFCFMKNFENPHGYANDLNLFGQYYRIFERLCEHWADVFPDSILRIQYENLVENPEQIYEQLAGFIGLPPLNRNLFDGEVSAKGVAKEHYGRSRPSTSFVGYAENYRHQLGALVEGLSDPQT